MSRVCVSGLIVKPQELWADGEGVAIKELFSLAPAGPWQKLLTVEEGGGAGERGLREACASFGLGCLGWQLCKPAEETRGDEAQAAGLGTCWFPGG